MTRSSAIGPIGRATQRLAVDGHHAVENAEGHRRDPLDEARLELLRVDPGKHVGEGIVRGNAVGRFRNERNQLSLDRPNVATVVQWLAPPMTAHIAIMRMSVNSVPAVGRFPAGVLEIGEVVGNGIEQALGTRQRTSLEKRIG